MPCEGKIADHDDHSSPFPGFNTLQPAYGCDVLVGMNYPGGEAYAIPLAKTLFDMWE